MVASSRSIAPLFVPGAPPPPLPLLTVQTDLSDHSRFPKIIAREELAPASRKKSQATRNKVQLRVPAPIRSLKPISSLPTTSSTRKATPKPPVDEDTDLDDISSDSSESLGSTSESDSDDSDNGRIPKPPGEASRPGRGGYNLEDALDWNQRAFKKLKKCVHWLVDEHLDPTKTISAQSLSQLRVVREQALDKVPDLNSYSHCWPAVDLIRMRLHYTSNRHRRELRMESAGALAGKGVVGKTRKRKIQRSSAAKP